MVKRFKTTTPEKRYKGQEQQEQRILQRLGPIDREREDTDEREKGGDGRESTVVSLQTPSGIVEVVEPCPSKWVNVTLTDTFTSSR